MSDSAPDDGNLSRHRAERMGKLIFSCSTSLDGYINDAAGNFDWTAPDEEVHAFVNNLLRPIGTYLFGRRMYETMAYWEAADPDADRSPAMRGYRSIWQATEKVVYSASLAQSSTARTRLEHSFVPAAVAALKRESERDLCIGGPTLAAHAFSAGLVDEVHLFLHPVIVGGGTRALAPGTPAQLDLVDERRFTNGVVYLRYALRTT